MRLSTYLLSLIVLTGLSQTAFCQQPYNIEGKLSGVADGTVIALMANEGNLLSTITTDTLHNGIFRFSGNVHEKTALAIMGSSPGFPSQWLDIWVNEGSRVSISGGDKLLKTWKVSSDIAEQKQQQRFMNNSQKTLNQLQELLVKERVFFDQREGADDQKHAILKRSIDSLRQLEDSLRKIISSNELRLLAASSQHDSYWMSVLKGLAIDARYSNDTTIRSRTLTIYQALNPMEKSSLQATEIYQLLYPPVTVKIGEKIADTLLEDLDGKTHHLADYKGKYLLIDFWSIGCGPCIAAMPEMKKLHDSTSKNLTVISFSLDQKKDTWKKASDQLKMNWLNFSDGKGMTGFASKYGVSGIPHYILVSPEGVLLDSWVGYSEGLLEKKVAQFVKPAAIN